MKSIYTFFLPTPFQAESLQYFILRK